MNESKQAMLEAVANLRKQVSKDTIQVGVLLQELDAFEAALRASAPQEGGRALEPVAWQKRPKFGGLRMWTEVEPDDREFWHEQNYETRPLYAAPLPSVALEAMQYTLPCDVHLDPATTIRAGCKLSTLMAAFKARESDAWKALTRPQPKGE